MTVIGFANKFYTLWDIRVDNIYTRDGSNRLIGTQTFHSYLKNISFDLDKVMKLYPNIPIWEDLRGKTSSFESVKYSYPADMISKGYYAGTLIASITDTRSLIWSYYNEYNEERCANIEAQLNSFELFKYEYDNTFLSLDKIKELEEERINKLNERNRIDAVYEAYQNGGTIETFFHKNLNGYGGIVIDNIYYKFKYFKTLYYNGIEYAIPVINSKGKKIKGKTLKLNVQTIVEESGPILLVSDFEILN